MRGFVYLSAILAISSPALAESYSVSLGAGGSGKTSAESFSGFDGSLGSLTKVVFDLSGSTTFNVQLPGSGGAVPPSGTVSYNFKNGLFLYVQPTNGPMFNYQPYLQQTGTGTDQIVFGEFEATTSGLHGLSEITSPSLLAAFLGTSFTGYYSVDDPFNSTVSVNGGPTTSLFGSTIEISAKSITGSVTYTYTPFGSAVPEPASWMMMIGGFGLIGGLRRRDRQAGARSLGRIGALMPV